MLRLNYFASFIVGKNRHCIKCSCKSAKLQGRVISGNYFEVIYWIVQETLLGEEKHSSAIVGTYHISTKVDFINPQLSQKFRYTTIARTPGSVVLRFIVVRSTCVEDKISQSTSTHPVWGKTGSHSDRLYSSLQIHVLISLSKRGY